MSDDDFNFPESKTAIPWWRTLLQLLGNFTGSAFAGAEAFGAPPQNRTAENYRTSALCLFVGGAALFLAAAIIHVSDYRIVGEAFGWSGIAFFYGSAFCGMRYSLANKPNDPRL